MRSFVVFLAGMVCFVPYGLKGVVWYQGEANTDRPYLWYGSDDSAAVYLNKELINTNEGVRPCIPDFVRSLRCEAA